MVVRADPGRVFTVPFSVVENVQFTVVSNTTRSSSGSYLPSASARPCSRRCPRGYSSPVGSNSQYSGTPIAA